MNCLDHVVLNTADGLDQFKAFFETMGFTITPRGYHTMGTINHTVVFKTDYLELLGYPTGMVPEHRPELVKRSTGLFATVIKADDADQVYQTLTSRTLKPRSVMNLARPLTLPDQSSVDVKFRVVMLEPDTMPGTVLYYCQHLTSEYVWRSEWQKHENGCIGIVRLVINVNDLKSAAQIYRLGVDMNRIEDIDDNTCILHLNQFQIILTSDSDKPLGMHKLVLGTESLEKVENTLVRAGINYQKDEKRIIADTMSHIQCDIEFEIINTC